MSDRLPGGKIHTYGLFFGADQIGFQCFANYTPTKKGTQAIFHSNRTVIHPDYAGLGLGMQVVNLTSELVQKKYGYRIMGKFSSVPMYKACIKYPCWKFLGAKRLFGELKRGGVGRNSELRKNTSTGFREKGVMTFHFEYIGNQ